MKTMRKHTVLLTGVIAVLILALCLFLLSELLRPTTTTPRPTT